MKVREARKLRKINYDSLFNNKTRVIKIYLSCKEEFYSNETLK